MECKGKKISVIGLCRTGLPTANMLAQLGASVFVSEIKPEKDIEKELKKLNKNVAFETGRHSELVLDAEIIIKSPGVKSDIPVLRDAAKRNVPVWSELELSSSLITPRMLIAVTGTNGKTTTTTLVSNILSAAGNNVITAGNIDKPLSAFVSEINSNTTVILEVSSYQLENTIAFKPDIACILNVTPDHLEHHGDMQEYIKAKKRIFTNQSGKDVCVLNHDDRICDALSADISGTVVFFSRRDKLEKNGVWYDGNRIMIDLPGLTGSCTPELKIPGGHNRENVLAAVSIAALAGVPIEKISSAVSAFNGIEHRLEFVRNIDGVDYINDSKSTNIDATKVALESFDGRLLLIMGGRDKGAPYTPLYDLVNQRVQRLYIIGEAAEAIKHDLAGAAEITVCKNLDAAVKRARADARTGDRVLLSPGCSSFDQFKDYEHRGHVYKEIVRGLL